MKNVLVLAAALFLAGCGAGLTHTLVADYGEKSVAVIAVMPVTSKSGDETEVSIFRASLIENLYFKGYGRIPSAAVDKAGSTYAREQGLSDVSAIPPGVLGNLLGADAIMYCTFEELAISPGYFFAPVSVAVSFNLVSAKTGETLWTSRSSVTERAFGITPKRVEMKSCQVYEAAVEEIMEQSLATLPAGPRYVAAPGGPGSVQELQ